MKISVTQFNVRVSEFIRDILAKEAVSPLIKFSLGVVASAGITIEQIAPRELLERIGIITDGDLVDIDRLGTVLRGGFSTCESLQLGPLKFDVNDAEHFISWLSNR